MRKGNVKKLINVMVMPPYSIGRNHYRGSQQGFSVKPCNSKCALSQVHP